MPTLFIQTLPSTFKEVGITMACCEAGLLISFGRGYIVNFSVLRSNFAIPACSNLTLRTFFLIPYLTKQDFVRDALEEMVALVAEGKLKLVIGGRYTFEQAQEMHVLLEQRATSGKLLLIPA